MTYIELEKDGVVYRKGMDIVPLDNLKTPKPIVLPGNCKTCQMPNERLENGTCERCERLSFTIIRNPPLWKRLFNRILRKDSQKGQMEANA